MYKNILANLYSLIRLQPMSSNTKNTDDIQFLATYGTLRDDDNSGAAWTKDFIKVFCASFSYMKSIFLVF